MIQKPGNDPTGPAQQARTKATAWASKTAFSSPEGRTSLKELGLRSAPNQISRPLRVLRRGPGQAERAAARRALRRGEATSAPAKDTEPEPTPDTDPEEAPELPEVRSPVVPQTEGDAREVQMDEEPIAPPVQAPADELPLEDWSAEQVIASPR